MATSIFRRTPEYRNLGRNGFSYSAGLQVQRLGDEITLRPINSKGDLTTCRIVIPAEVAKAVAALLIEAGSADA